MEIEPLKSFFSRMGGKSKIAKKLINQFPNPDSYTIYVEPFIGAGNIFFKKPYQSKTEVINDLDDTIYSIFQGVQKEGQLIEELKPISYLSKEEFMEIKNNPKKSWIEYLLLLKLSFFANCRSYNKSKPRKHNNPIIFKQSNFIKLKNRLKNVEITHQSFEKLIKEYNTPNTFFYLDPPYEGSKDYSNTVNPQDVYDAVKTIKGKFMLSYNDSAVIRELFKEFNIHTIETTYNPTQNIKNRIVTELYITNY